MNDPRRRLPGRLAGALALRREDNATSRRRHPAVRRPAATREGPVGKAADCDEHMGGTRMGTSSGVKPWRTLQRRPNPASHPERNGEVVLYSQWSLAPLLQCGLMDQITTVGIVNSVSSEDTEAIKLVRAYETPTEEAQQIEGWWIIDVCALEAVRVFPVVGLTGPQLTREQVIQNGLPTSRLRARISWMRSGNGCAMELDLNSGFRLAIEGLNVNVEILGPVGRMREPLAPGVADGVPRSQYSGGGIILDTVVTGEIHRSFGSNADLTETLTQTFCVPAGMANVRVRVPSRARLLRVSSLGPGLLNPMAWVIAETGVDLAFISDLFYDAALGRSTRNVPKPGDASHVITGLADPVNDRVFTFVWTLEI